MCVSPSQQEIKWKLCSVCSYYRHPLSQQILAEIPAPWHWDQKCRQREPRSARKCTEIAAVSGRGR